MENILFIDIDTQNDFMNPDGALYIPRAETIKPKLKTLIDYAQASNLYIIASLDTHVKDDPEFEQFPPHCIKNTYGNEKIKETKLDKAQFIPNKFIADLKLTSKQFVVEKNVFDIFANPNVERLLRTINPDECVVFGVATDYCVKCAAEGLVKRNYKAKLLTDAIIGIDEEHSKNIIKSLQRLGVDSTSTDEVLKGFLCALL